MDEPNATPEPPLVIPISVAKPPQPGFFEAVAFTFAFGVVLFGTVIVIVIAALIWLLIRDGANALQQPAGVDPTSVAAVPPDLIEPLAWSFPAGYAVGLLFTLLVFRIVAGRGWTREVGLRRLPVSHLLLGILALPGFVVVSDAIARLLFHLSGMDQAGEEQGQALGQLFGSYHWAFAVLAVGIGPGLVEELWCRGFLGRGLVSRYGWLQGVFFTSLFFGCLHLWPPPFVVVTAIMGAGLHFLYAMSRSLWVPITVHLLNNSFAVLMAVGVIPAERIENAFQARPVLITAAASLLLVTVGLAMWSARGRVPKSIAPLGIMVPAGCTVQYERLRLVWTILAVGFCGGLLALMFS